MEERGKYRVVMILVMKLVYSTVHRPICGGKGVKNYIFMTLLLF